MLNRLLLGLLVTLLAVGSYGTWHLLDQPVQTLRIKSDLSEGEQSQVEALLGGVVMGGILSLDLDMIRSTLADLGWAREIYVRRQWPAAIEVTLRRVQPIARWGVDEFVTAGSQIVTLPDQYPSLPSFEVELSDASQTLRVFSLIDRLVSPSKLELRELKQNARGEWQVTFAQGFSVYLGVERLAERIDRFLHVYNHALDGGEQEIAYVDVRYPSGAAVKFVEPAVVGELVAGKF